MKLAEGGFFPFLILDVGSLNALILRSPDSLSLKLGSYLGTKLINCSKKI